MQLCAMPYGDDIELYHICRCAYEYNRDHGNCLWYNTENGFIEDY